MPDAYRIHKQDGTYFLTFTITGWADALLRVEHKDLICDSFNFCIEKKGLEIFSYVIMTSHVHLLARAQHANLSDIVRDFKKYTSSQLISSMKSGNESRKEWIVKLFKEQNGKQTKKSANQIWQYNSHGEEVFSSKFALSKINYIHNNPVESGFVVKPHHHPHSSAQDYAGLEGPIKVSLLNLHMLML